MKESTRNQLCKMKKLTSSRCAKDGFDCCSKFFCKVSEIEMKALGYHIDKTDNPEIPYMGPNGCVIPPEYRPGCTMYVCPKHLDDRTFRREWESRRKKIFRDEAMGELVTTTNQVIATLAEDEKAMDKLL